jgi:protein-disulfide isomerase
VDERLVSGARRWSCVALVLAGVVVTPAPATAHDPHASHRTHADPASPAAPATDPATAAQLRALIAANPRLAAGLLAEVQRAAAERSEHERAARARALRARIESDAGGHAIGADAAVAQVVVVDFFDYHCGACKRATRDLLELALDATDVRFVFKELPVLADESRLAARAALAARAQGRYLELHTALMGASGVFTEARLLAIAADAGLDLEALRRDMAAPALDRELDETIALADSIGLVGTPAFVVNGELLAGRDPARLQELIHAARAPPAE